MVKLIKKCIVIEGCGASIPTWVLLHVIYLELEINFLEAAYSERAVFAETSQLQPFCSLCKAWAIHLCSMSTLEAY